MSTNNFGLPADVINKICQLFAKHSAIKTVTLYGSRAQGNYRLGSDIDLCIAGDTIDLTQLAQIATQLDDLLLPWKIDLTLKHKIDNQELLDHITKHGIVLYSANNS